MREITHAVLALCLWPALLQGADIYRCPEDTGIPRYQSTPCAHGVPLELPALNAVGEPLRPGEKALLDRRSDKAAKASKSVRPAADRQAQARRDGARCLQKRQQLRSVQAKLRRGYRPAEGERLRRRRDDYAEYVRAFCD